LVLFVGNEALRKLLFVDDRIVGVVSICFCVKYWLDDKSCDKNEFNIVSFEENCSLGLTRINWWETSWEFDDDGTEGEEIIDWLEWSVEEDCGRWCIVWDDDGGVDARELIPKVYKKKSRIRKNRIDSLVVEDFRKSVKYLLMKQPSFSSSMCDRIRDVRDQVFF
jgi:hypothetical protein